MINLKDTEILELVNDKLLTDEYYFDLREAKDFIKFSSKLKLPEGKNNELVNLMGFQLKIAIEILAIKRKSDRLRRFREVFITMSRKNAKSFLVALIILYLFFTDKEPRQQNIIVANSVQQATNVFDMLKFMTENNPTLMKHCKITASRRRIDRPNGSYIQVMSSDAGRLDSFNPFLALVDETHEDTTNGESFSKLRTGMGQRDEPIIFSVTTASNGQDENNLEFEKYTKAIKIKKGESKDDAFYYAIFRADDDCDLLDVEQHLKANPALDTQAGGFRKSEELMRFAVEAKENPIKEADFRRYYLNQHVILENERAIDMDKWKMSSVLTPDDLEFLKGRECYAGLDLSINKDFTAFVLVFPVDDKFYIIPHLFKPADTLIEDGKLDKFPYQAYAREGYIHATKGDFVNFRYVRQIINELAKEYEIKEIAFDKFSSGGIASDLQNDGFVMVDHIQGFGFSPTISDFYELLYSGNFVHDNNPVLNWMAKNTVAIENSTGKVSFDKRQGKIDGIIAMLMGLTRAVASRQGGGYDVNKAIEEWSNNL